jgi:hypothetical protein
MAELIMEHSTLVRTPEGEAFTPVTYGEEQADGRWIGWIEFRAARPQGIRLRTDRETTQPNRRALEYWASGLEAVYIEGAFARARSVVTGRQ